MLKHTNGDLLFFSYQLFQPFDSLTNVVSTRLGGVSDSPYHTLNLGLSVGDKQANVIQNRHLFCEAAGIDLHDVTVGHLIQGTHIEIVTSSLRGKGGLDPSSGLPRTDGMITNVTRIPLLLIVADCAAITFFDPTRMVIGLGHAYSELAAECQELCKLSKVLASFAGADKNILCILLLCYLTK